jgi:dihydrodipicolinate synthase/N-acetylneuraminate lyase
VDEKTLRELLEWHKSEGSDGVVILGTTGEASTLTVAEKELVSESETNDAMTGFILLVISAYSHHQCPFLATLVFLFQFAFLALSLSLVSVIRAHPSIYQSRSLVCQCNVVKQSTPIHQQVMTVAKETIGGVLPIVVGTGTVSTAATMEATKHAQSFGADAALVVSEWCERTKR